MSNSSFSFQDTDNEDIYCVFCDINYKYGQIRYHCNSKIHMDNRIAMLRIIPKGSLFCKDDGNECPHLIEEDNDWWCGIGFESIYGKRGELRTGKEFGEDERKPQRPLSCQRSGIGSIGKDGKWNSDLKPNVLLEGGSQGQGGS